MRNTPRSERPDTAHMPHTTILATSLLAATLTTTLIAAVKPGRRTAAALTTTAAATLYTLHVTLQTPYDTSWLPAVTLTAGYAALGALILHNNPQIASRLPESPAGTLIAAAALSTLLANDITIILLAPLLLLRTASGLHLAALLIGANVTGGLLPQGTPKNLLLIDPQTPYMYYLQTSWPSTAILAATGLTTILAAQLLTRAPERNTPATSKKSAPYEQNETHHEETRTIPRHAIPRHNTPRHNTPRKRARKRSWAPIALLAAAAAGQPVAEHYGATRTTYGAALILTATLAAAAHTTAHLRKTQLKTIAQKTPWILLPVVPVVTAAAPHIPQVEAATAAVNLTITGALLTDLTAGTVGSQLVAAGGIEAWRALGVASASAYLTPLGSMSGILLLLAAQKASMQQKASGMLIAAISAALSIALLAAL